MEKKPIFDNEFWRGRIGESDGEIHRAVRWCSIDQRTAYEKQVNALLTSFIAPKTSVLDIGCGPGLLLNIMPCDWKGEYLGIDLCQDFIDHAQKMYPGRMFECLDMRRYVSRWRYDIAVCFDFVRMIKDNAGEAVWQEMFEKIRTMADSLLVIEPPAELEHWQITHEHFVFLR